MVIKKLYEAFVAIKDHTLNTLVFEIPDIISRNNISKFKGLNQNIPLASQYLGTGRFRFDIPTMVEFDVIFSRKNPLDYQPTRAILKWVNVNPNIETDFLPAGYSGICLIDFPQGKPNMLKKLPEFGEEIRGTEYDILYLTTQPVMNKILQRL